MANETNFMDLNLDCQLMIFEKLSFSGLISMMETNKYFSQLATDVFRRKFSGTRIQFQAPLLDTTVTYNQTEGPIKLKDFDTISKVFKYFGPLIKSLKAKYLTSDMEIQTTINQLINTQCSDTLKQFDIISYKNNFFDDFSKPFKGVENVSVRGLFARFGGEDFCFSTLFPNMQRLTLQLAKGQNMSWFDREFKHLTHVNIDFCYYDAPGCFDEEILEKFVNKNPQIQSLRISYLSRKLLKYIAKRLNSLETLQVEYYDDDDDTTLQNDDRDEIYFENLKNLTMKRGDQSMPRNIFFQNLVELRTDANPRKCTRWIEFIETNKNLKKLVVFGRFLKKEEIVRMAAAKLNLVEVTMRCKKDMDYQTIVTFIEKSNQLRKLTLKFNKESMPRESFDTITKLMQKNLSVQWRMTEEAELCEIYLEK